MTNTPRIELHRNPSTQLANATDHQGVIQTFPLTTRGIYKAARTIWQQEREDEQRFGCIGAGSLRLTINGADITNNAILAEAIRDPSYVRKLINAHAH